MTKTYINVDSVRDAIRAEISRYDARIAHAKTSPIRSEGREIELGVASEGRCALYTVLWQINAISHAERHAAAMALLDKE